MENQQNIQHKVYLEQFNTYEKSLKKQNFELKLWKMRIETISDMKNKEMQLIREQTIKMNDQQDKVNRKKMQNCDYLHNLVKNSWLLNLEENLKILTPNEETKKEKSNILSICNKLQDKCNQIDKVLNELHFKKLQEKQIIKLNNKINDVLHSTIIWNYNTFKTEKEKSK